MQVIKKASYSLLILSIILLLFYPEQCISAARIAIEMWFYSVVPSLLPFFILSSLLVSKLSPYITKNNSDSKTTKFLFGLPSPSIYAIMTGMISGYPAGARITGEMLTNGVITKSDAIKLLPYTLCCSPTFLAGTVCVSMLNAPILIVPMMIAHFLGAFLCGQSFRMIYNVFPLDNKPLTTSKKSIHTPITFVDSVEKAMQSMLFIGGTMVLFSVFIKELEVIGMLDILAKLFQPTLHFLGLSNDSAIPFIEGVIEMANGVSEAAVTPISMLEQGRLSLIILSFGSLSVALQSMGMLKNTGIKLKHYVFPKILHAIISVTIFSLLTPLLLSGSVATSIEPLTELIQLDVFSLTLVFSVITSICYLAIMLFIFNIKSKRIYHD